MSDKKDDKHGTRRIPVWWHKLPVTVCKCHENAGVEVLRSEVGYSDYVFRELSCKECGSRWRDHVEEKV